MDPQKKDSGALTEQEEKYIKLINMTVYLMGALIILGAILKMIYTISVSFGALHKLVIVTYTM